MKWTTRFGEPVIVYTDEDLELAAPLFQKARELWVRDGRDEGSVVMGAGIGVLYLPKRARKPREYIVIPSPFQGDGGRNVHVPLNYLARHGVAAFHVYGRMD